jgi:hypothetical protein
MVLLLRIKHPTEIATLIITVLSSRFMNVTPETVSARWRWGDTPPTSQIAWRLVGPEQSNAPAVASASTCGAVGPIRRTSSAMLVYGPLMVRSVTICSAVDDPPGPAAPASPLRGLKPFARKGSGLASSEYEHLLVGPPGQGGRPIRYAQRCPG